MRERLWATVAIWAAFATAAVTLVAVFASRSMQFTGGITLLGLMALLVAGAVAGTRVVWQSRCQERDDVLSAQQANRRRVERLADNGAEAPGAEELHETQRDTVITTRRPKD